MGLAYNRKGKCIMINIVNLTPHPLMIFDGECKYSPIPSSGVVRVSQIVEQTGEVAGIPVYETVFGSDIEGLPELYDDGDEVRIYVVSRIAAEAIREESPDWSGVYFPGQAVRDADGKIVGCNGLSRL
jgi:hypothetical protein|nr:MAG TPA: hypothetical protein [Caudoviricetes sp.]